MSKKSHTIQMIAEFDGDVNSLILEQEEADMPILVTRNMLLFPGVIAPIVVGRQQSVRLVEWMKDKPNAHVAVACQHNPDVENPTQADIFDLGVTAHLIRAIDMSPQGGGLTIIMQGLTRCKISDMGRRRGRPFYTGKVTTCPEDIPEQGDKMFEAAVSDLRNAVGDYVRQSDDLPDDMLAMFSNMSHDVLFVNFAATNLPLQTKDKMEFLAASSMSERIMLMLKAMNRDIQLFQLKNSIRNRTREELDTQQREYFLQQQLKNIREELGTDDNTAERRSLEEKAKKKKWGKETEAAFREEMAKLDLMNPQSPDYATQVQYLQTVVSLPWNEMTKDNLSMEHAQRVLDHDHYGMEKVKERILEHLAVLSLRGDLKSPIICLAGPPGVGKTSLGKSIAKALGRKYARVSLGGLHDEAEIRGHRRTYIGAMPGRIIKALQKTGAANPVFILDEIDKVATDTFHGDPSSALLEVLDPEQNNSFHDNYIDIDFDLSHVMFIATANDLGSIPRPLLDRMEVITLDGYITEEKIEIARRHLIPKQLRENGFKSKPAANGDPADGETAPNLCLGKPQFQKQAIEYIIERYTRESGVRQLDKQIGKALRKIALATMKKNELAYPKVSKAQVEELLGKAPYYRDIYQGNEYAGVVTGLAWTSVGGEILFIETSLSKGKQAKLTLTGNLGDVMKESAIIALEYVKAHADELKIDSRIFEQWNIHIHVPEGATPKDGPSAGITIATSIASAITQRRVREATAMTGEITLRGKVLPVGGIKEKILAARRAGIHHIVMCADNKRDIDEIPEIYLRGLDFHYVDNVSDVWKFALTDEQPENPVTYSFDEVSDSKH